MCDHGASGLGPTRPPPHRPPCRGGIEGVHATVGVDVVDQLVKVLKPAEGPGGGGGGRAAVPQMSGLQHLGLSQPQPRGDNRHVPMHHSPANCCMHCTPPDPGRHPTAHCRCALANWKSEPMVSMMSPPRVTFACSRHCATKASTLQTEGVRMAVSTPPRLSSRLQARAGALQKHRPLCAAAGMPDVMRHDRPCSARTPPRAHRSCTLYSSSRGSSMTGGSAHS